MQSARCCRAAVTHERADGRDLGIGSEAAAQEPEGVELLEPLAVGNVGLATRYAFDVTRVDEQDLEATLLEDLEERDPVDTCRLHGDGLDAADVEPVGEGVKVRGEALELAHRLIVPILGDRDPVARRADVDSCRVQGHACHQ